MLLLIDTQELRHPAPEPSPKRGWLRFSRPGRPTMLLILALALVIAGLLTNGLVSALLLFLGLLAACSAGTRAMQYTAGLAEHHQ
jgi:4-hydroxybenzoate polyprenyltransferase